MVQNQMHHFLLVIRFTEANKHVTWAAFLHLNRHDIDIQRTALHENLQRKAQFLTGHIVQVANDFHDIIVLTLRLTQKHADTVGDREILSSHTVANTLGGHHGSVTKRIGKMLEDSGAGGRAELAADLAAIGRHILEARFC